MGTCAVAARKAGTGEVARATPEMSPTDASSTEVSPAADTRTATEGMTTAPEMTAAPAALRESLPAGEHGGECSHGPESTFAG
jgi:hypothetical protein